MKEEHPDMDGQDEECHDSPSERHKIRLQENGQIDDELDAKFERY
jgi:hypothetical protein